MISLIIFIIILSVLILVHEWGHYITAVKCGITVEQFALGFGPKLYSWKKGDTEFCLCAIPLGGFVKMAGDDRSQLTGKKNEFFSKPVGYRALVVVMGPVVNFILAFVCFYLVFVMGYVDMEATDKRVPAVIGQITDASPAKKAGIQPGDRVIRVSGIEIQNWPQMKEAISTSSQDVITVDIIREERPVSLMIRPHVLQQKDIFGRFHPTKVIGVGPYQNRQESDFVIVRYGPIQAIWRACEEIWTITVKTYVSLYEMAIGARSPKEAMGIVGMFVVIKLALHIGFSFLLHMVGVISASLAIFNLLPLIPLDGGHLLILAIEKIRGRVLSLRVDMWLTRIGFGLILTLALFVFYADFERIGWVDKIMKIFHPGS